jgi:hypothetical protein
MNDTAAATEYRRDEVAYMLNARVSFDGNTAERRDGSKRTHATALNSGAQGYGGIEFTKANGDKQIVVFVGDKMYYSTDYGLNWTNPSGATSLTTARWSLAQMRVGATNVLLCANGGTSVYKWDGTTWNALTNAPSGAKYVAVFHDRAYYAGHSGNTVVGSKVGDPDTIAAPDGLSLQVSTHDGDSEILGIYQIGPVLCVWKRQSFGYIEGFGFRSAAVEAGAEGISRSVGCIAPGSIRPVAAAGVMWLSERGFEHWQPGGLVQLVSRPVQAFIDNLSWSNIIDAPNVPTALWFPRLHEYWCAVPRAGGTNDYIFAYRPPLEHGGEVTPPCIYLFRQSAATGNTAYVEDGYLHYEPSGGRDLVDVESGYLTVGAINADQYTQLSSGYLALASVDAFSSVLFTADKTGVTAAPFSVGYDGYVREHEEGELDDVTSAGSGGVSIGGRITSRPMLFGDVFRKKRGRALRVHAKSENSTTLETNLITDASHRTTHTLDVAAGTMPTAKRARVNGKGYALQVDCRFSDKIQVAGLEVFAEPIREAV